MFEVVMGRDERSYAYSYMRVLSELFVVMDGRERIRRLSQIPVRSRSQS